MVPTFFTVVVSFVYQDAGSKSKQACVQLLFALCFFSVNLIHLMAHLNVPVALAAATALAATAEAAVVPAVVACAACTAAGCEKQKNEKYTSNPPL